MTLLSEIIRRRLRQKQKWSNFALNFIKRYKLKGNENWGNGNKIWTLSNNILRFTLMGFNTIRSNLKFLFIISQMIQEKDLRTEGRGKTKWREVLKRTWRHNEILIKTLYHIFPHTLRVFVLVLRFLLKVQKLTFEDL